MGISPARREPRGDLVPAPRGLFPLQVEGPGHRLARDGKRPGQAPGMQGGLRTWGSLLWRPRVQVRRMGEESGQHRGDERGLQERCRTGRSASIASRRCTDVSSCMLSSTSQRTRDRSATCRGPRWGGRFVRKKPDPWASEPHEAERQCRRTLTDRHIGINDPAIEAQGLLREQRIEVGPRQALLGDLPASDRGHLRLPVVFEADDELHGVGFAGPQPCQTGRGQVGQQAIASPGLVHLQMPAIRLAGGTNMILDRGPTADREDCMDRDGRIVPRPQESPPSKCRGP